MLCSILIPSRKRFDRLKKLVNSIYRHPGDYHFEVIIRFDDDDMEARSRLNELDKNRVNLICTFGKRCLGFDHLYLLWEEMAERSCGQWLWSLSDDMVIEGDDWNLKLSQVPTEFSYVQPQIHKLGFSKYDRDAGGPVPLVTRESWNQHKFKLIDASILQVAREQNWTLHWLDGIGVHHQRDDESKLLQERAS